jgi:lipopolysaccharide assembly outer membrane protein LptD (OstA)
MKCRFFSVLVSVLSVAVFAWASIGSKAEMKANEILQDQMSEITTLKGEAKFQQGANHLTADKIMVDPKMGFVSAEGNCVYRNAAGTPTKAEKMIFKISQAGEWVPLTR